MRPIESRLKPIEDFFMGVQDQSRSYPDIRNLFWGEQDQTNRERTKGLVIDKPFNYFGSDLAIALYDYSAYRGGERVGTDSRKNGLGWTLKMDGGKRFHRDGSIMWEAYPVSEFTVKYGSDIPKVLKRIFGGIFRMYGVFLEPVVEGDRIIYEREDIRKKVIFELRRGDSRTIHGSVSIK